jgi:hypothetical protein
MGDFWSGSWPRGELMQIRCDQLYYDQYGMPRVRHCGMMSKVKEGINEAAQEITEAGREIGEVIVRPCTETDYRTLEKGGHLANSCVIKNNPYWYWNGTMIEPDGKLASMTRQSQKNVMGFNDYCSGQDLWTREDARDCSEPWRFVLSHSHLSPDTYNQGPNVSHEFNDASIGSFHGQNETEPEASSRMAGIVSEAYNFFAMPC